MKKALLLLSISICFLLNINSIDKNQGIVLQKKANIYEMPSQTSKIINNLNQDEIFIIKNIKKINNNDKNNYFLEIEKNNKTLGWIYKTDVGVNVLSDKLGENFSNLKFLKYLKMLNDNNVTLWLIVTEYQFDQYFYGFVLSTKTDNKSIKWLNNDTEIKLFENKDINNDGFKEILLETNWHGFTDPTNGSTLDIYSIADGNVNNIFNINTSYASHEFEIYLNSIIIKNKEINVTNFYLGKGVYHEKGKETFGTFWTIPIKKKEIKFEWSNDLKKYKITSEKDNIPMHCKSLVDSLRMRENPNLNGNILKVIKKDEEFIVDEVTEGYPNSKIELQPGIFGFWVKIIDNDNVSGWAFSYYFNFYDSFINSYMKFDGNKKDLFTSMNTIKLVELK